MRDNRQQIAEEAAEWFVRMGEAPVPEQNRAEFVEWLLDSPVHVHEYLAVARLWDDCAHIDPDKEFDLKKPLPFDDGDSNVVPLGDSAADDSKTMAETTGRGPRVPFAVAASIAAVAATLIGLLWLGQTSRAEDYVTGIGEQRSIALADGSIIKLNTRTQLVVESRNENRSVKLVKGEALFDVEKDPSRPFLVDTGDALIQVLGTRFNVYKKESGTYVTVLEGEVSVMRVPDPGKPPLFSKAETPGRNERVVLSAGVQARITPQAERIETVTANTGNVVAWQDRRLKFEAQSLDEIVAEFNRYNKNRIEVGDAGLAGLKLDGVFKANDPDSLIEYLHTIRDVQIITRSDGTRVLALLSSTKN